MHRNHSFILTALLLGAMVPLAGCQGALLAFTPGPSGAAGSRARGPADQEADMALLAAMGPPLEAAELETPHLSAVTPRKVIYSADLAILVADVLQAVTRTRKIAEEAGGYMQKMTRSAIEIRVPAGQFDSAVAQVEKLGSVTRRNITAADVTEEYVDLEIRLSNARALGAKLVALLDKATNVKEALAVEKELARARTEIERLEGKLNVLASRVAFSTIVINFTPMADAPRQLRTTLPFWWLRGLGLGELMGFDEGRL